MGPSLSTRTTPGPTCPFPGHESRLLDAYGVAPDPERLFFYRVLWDLT
jgi:aminoglycoside phosphotransferase